MSYFYLTTKDIIYIHDTVLNDEPGLPGLSRDKSLEGALARIQNHSHYDGVDDLHEIAALYGIALAQGHVFNDGNKRTFSLMAMYIFLFINGYMVYEEETKANDVILQVAQKKLPLNKLANWLRINSVNISKLKKTQRRLKKEIV